jgi:hypothetical protein
MEVVQYSSCTAVMTDSLLPWIRISHVRNKGTSQAINNSSLFERTNRRHQALAFFFLVSLGGVRLSPLGTSAIICLLYQPRIIDDDYRAVGGMRIGRGNRSTRRKPAPEPLCPPQIPHYLTWDGTRAAAVGSQRLTALAIARRKHWHYMSIDFINKDRSLILFTGNSLLFDYFNVRLFKEPR